MTEIKQIQIIDSVSPDVELIKAGLIDSSGNQLIPMNLGEVGKDYVLCVGQSNMSGHSTTDQYDANIDFTNPRILQRPPTGTYQSKEILAADPLWHHDKQNQGAIGLGLSFAKKCLQAIAPNRVLVLLPQAWGGTGFRNNRWRVGDDLYNSAVNNTNTALIEDSNNRLIAIIWHQGESDVNYSKYEYAEQLDTMIVGLRNSISGANDVPFFLGEMAETWVGSVPERVAIQEAIRETPSRLKNTYVVSSSGLAVDGTGIHFSGEAYRSFGERYAKALNDYQRNIRRPKKPEPPANITVSEISAYGAEASFGYGNGLSEMFNLRYRRTQIADDEWTIKSSVYPVITINNLSANTEYEFQLRSVNSQGNSDWTTAQTFTTIAEQAIPATHVDLKLEGNLNDDSPNGYTVTNDGTSFVTDATRDQVLSVSTNQRLSVPSGIGADHTKMAWVWIENIQTVNQNLCSSEDAAAHFLWLPVDGRMSLGLEADIGGMYVDEGDYLYAKRWYHVVATISGTIGRLYVNGKLSNERTDFTAFPGVAAPNPIGVGGSLNTSTSPFPSLEGKMSRFKLFNTALSEAQVRQIYHQEKA